MSGISWCFWDRGRWDVLLTSSSRVSLLFCALKWEIIGDLWIDSVNIPEKQLANMLVWWGKPSSSDKEDFQPITDSLPPPCFSLASVGPDPSSLVLLCQRHLCVSVKSGGRRANPPPPHPLADCPCLKSFGRVPHRPCDMCAVLAVGTKRRSPGAPPPPGLEPPRLSARPPTGAVLGRHLPSVAPETVLRSEEPS